MTVHPPMDLTHPEVVGDGILASARVIRDDIWTVDRILDPGDSPMPVETYGFALATRDDYRTLAAFLPKTEWEALGAARRVILAADEPHDDGQRRRAIGILDVARDVTLRIEADRRAAVATMAADRGAP